MAERAARLSETDTPLGAVWSAADPAARAVLDLVAEIMAEEYVARMKATAPRLEEPSNESSDLRPVQF